LAVGSVTWIKAGGVDPPNQGGPLMRQGMGGGSRAVKPGGDGKKKSCAIIGLLI
jgi:hypothetical protein